VKSIDQRSPRRLGTGNGTLAASEPLSTLPTHVEPCAAIDGVDAFVIDLETFATHERVQAAIAEARAVGRMRLQSSEQLGVRWVRLPFVAPRRSASPILRKRSAEWPTAASMPRRSPGREWMAGWLDDPGRPKRDVATRLYFAFVATAMGHEKVDTSLNVYTQVIDGAMRTAAQQVGPELFTIVHGQGGQRALTH
jgi:hypothetical protein